MARLIKAAYKLLCLETFFTTGADESRAWTYVRGMKAPQTAGIIHTEDQFGQMIAAGMQAACDDTGAYMYRGCSNLDASKEFELVNTYASMDIDAIRASPASQEGSNAVFQQLANQGITVVYVNSAQELGEATAFLSAQFSSNNEALAATAADYAAEWLAENMPGEKIVVGTMSVKEGSTPIEQR